MTKPAFLNSGLRYVWLVLTGVFIAAAMIFLKTLLVNDTVRQQIFPNYHFHPNFISGPDQRLLFIVMTAGVFLVIEVGYLVKLVRFPDAFKDRFKLAFLSATVLSILLQTISVLPRRLSDVKHLAGKTEEQRSDYYFDFSKFNRFIRFCQEYIKGSHAAQLITDINIEQQPGDYYYRLMAVSLYPIDVRGIRGERRDVLLIFDKSDPYNSVPSDYQVLAVYDQRSLLAVRRGHDAHPY